MGSKSLRDLILSIVIFGVGFAAIVMRAVFKKKGKDVIFSPQMIEEIELAHLRGEQSIVLLNRRGFSQFVLCRTCGETIKCENCDISLTYHRRERLLICHYCNYRINVPKKCPQCASEYLYFIGEGTEQLEDVLVKKFPNLRIARVDRDTVSKRHEMERILTSFGRGELDMRPPMNRYLMFVVGCRMSPSVTTMLAILPTSIEPSLSATPRICAG